MYYSPQTAPKKQAVNHNIKKPKSARPSLKVDALYVLYCVLSPLYLELTAKLCAASSSGAVATFVALFILTGALIAFKVLYEKRGGSFSVAKKITAAAVCVLGIALPLFIWSGAKEGSFSTRGFFYIFFFSCALGLLCYVVGRLFPKRGLRYVFTLVVTIVESVIVGYEIIIYKQFFHAYQGLATTTGNAGDIATNGFIGNVITSVIANWYVLIMLFIPVIILVLFRREICKASRPPLGFRSLMLVFTAICYMLALILVYTNADSKSVYATSSYTADGAMKEFGVLTGMRLDVRYTLFGSNTSHSSSGKNAQDVLADDDDDEETTTEPDEEITVPEGNNEIFDFASLSSENSAIEELNEYFATQSASSKNKMTGLFEGKNCIFISAESFTPYFISKEATPTLYKLMNEGFVIDNYYQPAWGVSTSDGEYSGLTGLVPEAGVNSMKLTIGNNLHTTLGNSFTRLGYFTEAFHANSYTYYDRNLTHPNFGYSQFIGYGNGIEETVTKTWPESDVEAMDYIIPIIKQQVESDTPFHIYYMSVSGHPNYSFSGNYIAGKNEDLTADLPYSDTVKAYYACNYEFEFALQYLMEELENMGALDDTVIVINADHYPYGLDEGFNDNTQDYLSELVGHTVDQNFERHKNRLIIYCSDMTYPGTDIELSDEDRTVTDPCYSLDILPTLSNLFGFEFDSRLYTGRDIFSDASPLVLFRNYSWITSKGSYNYSTKEFTSTDGTEVSDDYISSVNEIVRDKVYFAKQILETDYFNYLPW